MTADLEERIRSTLRSWASEVPARTGDSGAVLAGATDSRSTTRRWLAAAVVTAVIAGLVFVAVRAVSGSDGTDVATDLTTEAVLGDPPTIIYRPADAGWELTDIWLVVEPPQPTYLEYRFAHEDGRRLELSVYPRGTREATSGLPESATVTVRDRPGKDTTYGNGRYRIDWDEAGRTWEATGYEFESLEALAEALIGFQVADPTTWHGWLPADVSAHLDSNPRQGFGWSKDEGLTPREIPTCPSVAPLDTPLSTTYEDDFVSGSALRAPEALKRLATQLFPGYTLTRSHVIPQSGTCRSRRVELDDGTERGFVMLEVSDVLGLQNADALKSSGVRFWENEGVVSVSVLTGRGREAAVTAGMAGAETENLVRDPAFADQLRAAVEALGY